VTGPNESRLIPDVDNLLTCFVEGVSSAATAEEWPLTVLPLVRFLLLIVTLEGMKL
jgi:hypothetical protein